jgi:tRNA-dihydrouridine synthase A
MAEPQRVGRCIAAMREAVTIPVTVKSRIGIDEQDSYGFLRDFVGTVAAAGCATFIVHARKAILHGLSPKENRDVPPLDYTRAWQLKRDFPGVQIIVNGGLKTVADCVAHGSHVDGVMIGREAYHRPMFLAELAAGISSRADDRAVELPTPERIIAQMRPYIVEQLERGVPLHAITRHMLGLFTGRLPRECRSRGR